MSGQPFVHPGPAKFAGMLTSWGSDFIKTSGELVKAKAERDAALATIRRVRALHRRRAKADLAAIDRCRDDGHIWPCRTIAALGEPS